MQSRHSTRQKPQALLEHESSPERAKPQSRFAQDKDLPLSQSLEQQANEDICEERSRLISKEQQKRRLAGLLHEQQQAQAQQIATSKNSKTEKSTGKERLDLLLSQTELYTQFVLQSKSGDTGKDDSELKALQSRAIMHMRSLGGNPTADRVGKRRKSKSHSHGGTDGDFDQEQLSLTRLEAQPTILKGGDLRDYQLTSLNWLISLYETGINGILADEMGLGKTIQTIAFLAFLREYKKVNGYHLVIVPKAVIPNWRKELKKWLPECRVVNLIATKTEREEILKTEMQPGQFDLCLTTFEGVRICMSHLLKFKWEYLIVDEAHKLKNEDSQISKRLRELDSRYRLLLTGTPLQNNLHELWSLLNFLLPEIFQSSGDFDEWFNLGTNGGQEEMTDAEKEAHNKSVIEQLHRILRPFLLRRLKREVEKALKPKVEIHVNVGITELQKSIYRSLLKQSKLEKGNSVTHYKNILVQLRKVCNHPYLFDQMEPEDAEEIGEHLVTNSGKMRFLDPLAKKSKADGNQMLIFSGFTSMLDILEDWCALRKFKYCRLDGNTSLQDREEQIDEFTAPGSDINVFLISTRAGGLGLNLMTANIVVLYDSDWNPQMDLQAMDRAHRIGQTKVVQVFRLITQNTMEEKMMERQTLKLKLDSMIIQKGRQAPKQQGFNKEEMADMVKYGADTIFQVGDQVEDKDIEQLIKEGEQRASDLFQKANDVGKEKMNMLDFEMNSMNLYSFEDVDYQKQRREEENIKLNELVRALITEETAARGGRRKTMKANLAESNLCPKFFQSRSGAVVGVSEETKKKKLQIVQDYRFFPDPERLKELLEKELDSKFYQGYNLSGLEESLKFTEEEKIEKECLLEKGFYDWDRRDFQKFMQAIELYPRDRYDLFAGYIGTKSAEQVRQYGDVFYKNTHLLNDRERIEKMLSKSENHHSFVQQAPLLIKGKCQAYERPLEEMLLNPIQKSKYFSREADIALLCLTDELGYGNWKQIKHAVRRDTRVRFDCFFKSRSEAELSKRVDILVKSIQKEHSDYANGKAGKSKMNQSRSKMQQSNSMMSGGNNNCDVDMADMSERAKNGNKDIHINVGEDEDMDEDESMEMGRPNRNPQSNLNQDDMDLDSEEDQENNSDVNNDKQGNLPVVTAAELQNDDDESSLGDNFEGLEEAALTGLKRQRNE